MKDYVRMSYGYTVETPYPGRLIGYLVERFGLTPGDKTPVLDAGCGRGDFTRAFISAGFPTVGMDLSETSLSYVPKPTYFFKADLEKRWPFEDEAFRVVFLKSVLEHLTRPEEALAEAFRVLEPGGRVIVLAPPYTGPSFWDDCQHRSPFTAAKLFQMLEWCEFAGYSVESFYQVPALWKHPRLLPLLRLLPPVGRAKDICNLHLACSPMILGSGVKPVWVKK